MFLQDKLREYEFASLAALCRVASYHLLQHEFFRTSFSVNQHLRDKARRAQSEDEYVTCADRQAQALLTSTYNALSAPRSTSRRIAFPQPNVNPAATLLVQQTYEETPIEVRRGGSFWSRCRNQAHALNKSAGSACSEQELDLALLVMMNRRTNIFCKGCGAANRGGKCRRCDIRECIECRGVAQGNPRCSRCFYQHYKDREKKRCMVCRQVCYEKICSSCERHVNGLDLLACVEEGCNADRVGSLKRCAKCFRKRQDERRKRSGPRPPYKRGPIILSEGPCKDCAERLPKGTATGVCRPCRQHASRLEAPGKNGMIAHCQSRTEDEKWADNGDDVEELAKSSNQRQQPGKDQFKDKTEVRADRKEPRQRGRAEQIESKGSAKVADGNFQLGVVNKRKRDQDDEDGNNPNPCEKQKRPDGSEQSPEYCDEDCGNLKQGKSSRCADCAREWRNKRCRDWQQKKRDKAHAAEACEEENCTRPREGLSPRCAECRQKRKHENKRRRNKKRTAEAQESREIGVPLGECRKCKEPHDSEKGLCPACLRAYKAQRKREKRREDGIETNCVEDGCDREIMPGRARCAGCLERVKPICERCNEEGRPGLARCKPCQRVVDKENQKRRDESRGLRKQQAAVQSADVEEHSEEDDDRE